MSLGWKYERGEDNPGQPRSWHRWGRTYAGFVGGVGKCPCDLDRYTAEWILNHRGIEVSDSNDTPYPDRIYATYQGIVYVPRRLLRGVPITGFPGANDGAPASYPKAPAVSYGSLPKRTGMAGSSESGSKIMAARLVSDA